MTAFLHALAEHNLHQKIQDATAPAERNRRGLSVDEIYSNLFVINFAGHDTTANTLAFTMFLLAGNPNVQAWLSEEIQSATKDVPTSEWDYKTLFPKLTRCRAVLLETLRLYPPVMILPKSTSSKIQTLRFGSKTLNIPPGITTSLYIIAMQTHPKYWSEPFA
ncbi:Cytochrome P450 monooxygenase [Cladobotryum mycophilum]|uniref:Cytochrome P450 monooxygenase n=1 Tax=Cladobotryum mycophilum TaxID=491253 RepID=A0ABR0SNS1_9HYPO